MVTGAMGLQHDSFQQRYDKTHSALVPKYPNLENKDYKRWHPQKDDDHVRTAYFRYGNDQILEQGICKGVDHLHDLLETTQKAAATQPSRTLLIIEGTNAAIRNLLVVEMGIDPQVFHRHARVAMWEASRRNAGNTPCLPSLVDPNETFSLAFSQLMHLNLADQQFTLRCLENERHIASSRCDGKLDGVGAISRKLTFCAKRLPNDGWNAILLVDKPFKIAMCGDSTSNAVAKALKDPEPFQGGYADFIKHDSVEEVVLTESPPRNSMFDDLVFYHKHHHKHLGLTKEPVSATVFARKIVASEYMLLIEYNRYLINHLGWKLTRRDGFEIFDSSWVEKAWSDINAFHRRIDDHVRNVTAARGTLGHTGLPQPANEWTSTVQDFRHIEDELLHLRYRSEGLLSSLTSLAGIVGNRQALDEARSVRVLTFLGMTFLPLSLVASLFSMTEHFGPGAGQFWVYFAVSIPLVFLVFGLALVSTHAKRLLKMVRGTPAG